VAAPEHQSHNAETGNGEDYAHAADAPRTVVDDEALRSLLDDAHGSSKVTTRAPNGCNSLRGDSLSFLLRQSRDRDVAWAMTVYDSCNAWRQSTREKLYRPSAAC
jgi:hypothetical protein